MFKAIGKIRSFIDGYKTYITAIGVAVVAGCQAYGIQIDPWVWSLLAAVGLGSIRSAAKKLEFGE